MTNDSPIDESAAGLDRRSLIKRGAIVGGALVWTTPIVQSIASPAFADTSPTLQGCLGGGVSQSYYVKFNVGGGPTFFQNDNPQSGEKCQIPLPAGTLQVQPPNTLLSQFSISGITTTGTPKTPGSTQSVTVTLPPGFSVEMASVKAGQGSQGQTDDADADTGSVVADGCIDEDMTDVVQTGNQVKITITNSDTVEPGISNVRFVFTGCVPA